jgi:hypothetical protein
VRRAELDSGGSGLEQRFDLGGDLAGGAAEREAVEHGVGDQPSCCLVITGADQELHRGQVDFVESGRGIQRGDDREVGGHLRPGQVPGPRPVLVDHGNRPAYQADLARRPARARLAARQRPERRRQQRRVRGTADLDLGSQFPGQGYPERAPRPEQQVDILAQRPVREAHAGFHLEDLAPEGLVAAGEQVPDHVSGLSQPADRPLLGDPDRV